MNPEIVSRIIKLIDQTGDKIVMMDPASERAIVIMDLANYEKMASGQNSGSASPDRPASPVEESVSISESVAAVSSAVSVTKAAASRGEAADQLDTPFIEPADEWAEEPGTEDTPETVEIESISRFQKKPSIYVNSGQRDPLAESAFSDLTQTELLDKINRDIAAWKTAQDRKRTDELRAAASQGQALASADALEEEERFYLEPID